MCPENQCHAIQFLPTSIFTDDITTVMNSYWIDSVFTANLELKHYASSKVCLICTGTGFALAMMFLHSFHL